MVVASGELAEWLDARGITARVTISDERDYAVSFVIAETGTVVHEPAAPRAPASDE
jgi:holo-[acyl-carrier protein] synthase